MTRKRWRTIGSQEDLRKVVVGTKIRNNQTGKEFVVVKVGGIVDGILQVEARPLLTPTTFVYRDGKWGFV